MSGEQGESPDVLRAWAWMQALVIHYGTCWHMQPRDIQDCLRPYCFASVVLLKDFEASRRHGQTQYEAYRLMADKWMPDGTLKK